MKSFAPIIIASLLVASMRAPAQETNAGARPDFNSFKIIAERNIFDPTRTGRRRPGAPPRRVERVSLVGTSIDNGDAVAIFTGNGVPERPFKTGDTVKDFKIVQITLDSVRLTGVTNTNMFVMDYDSRRSLRREENGPWQGSSDLSDPVLIPSGNADDPAPSASASAPPAGGGGESDIIKRLRLKREQEEK
ncbi:MAG: hypothetical protein ABSH38_11025 [Verrucomicrobiota bacterium]|jgi:hypothetical protein